MMLGKGIHKEPGRSCIEVDKIHVFVAGDTSHPEAKELCAELKKVTEKIKAEGYTPDTQLVLRDNNEEFKEKILFAPTVKSWLQLTDCCGYHLENQFVYPRIFGCAQIVM